MHDTEKITSALAFDECHQKENYILKVEVESGEDSEVEELRLLVEEDTDSHEEHDDSLEDLENLVGVCSRDLRRLKENQGDAFENTLTEIAKIEFGLDQIKQRLLTCAYFKLTVQDLTDLKEQSMLPVDPSIEFFGIEWTSVFSRLYSLGVEIRLLKAGLEQERLSFLRLRAGLQLVNQLIAELQMHAAAVSSGRMSSSHLNFQLRQQQNFTNIGRAASFRNTAVKGSAPRRKQQKYKGSRTDSALTTKEHRESALTNKEDRWSKHGEKKVRKNSFVDSLSNILRGSLKL